MPAADLITAALDDALLTLDELCRAAAVTPQWVQRCVEEELLVLPQPAGPNPADWRFAAPVLHRVRRMRQVERDFDAVPELAALVADLHDEIDDLRARLRRTGGLG